MIQFIEDSSSGYKHRTYENTRLADITIAFACNFETSGERMTENAATEANKSYLAAYINERTKDNINIISNRIIKLMQESNLHTINVAGNGMSRFVKYGFTQKDIDDIVYNVLKLVSEKVEINSIRSGGQTGADESGLKAAEKLGIEAICLCPKGWRFRNETEDISDEVLFKERFNN